jgi:hypothetical protein
MQTLGTKQLLVVILFSLSATIAFADDPAVIDVPIRQLGRQYRLIGELHWPIDKIITVQGVVVEGPFKGFEGGPNLRPQIIQGRATQEAIQIKVVAGRSDGVKIGESYQLEGYERIEYIGRHEELANREPLIQTTSRYLQNTFVVVSVKRIEPVKLTPAQFEGRKALFQGVARNDQNLALMVGDGWTVIVNPDVPWPSSHLDKLVETWGTYQRVAPSGKQRATFSLIDGTLRLVNLDDQLGRQVELRGRAWSLNGIWWLSYRGIPVYVENMSSLPGWSGELHGSPVTIHGELDRARVRQLQELGVKPDRNTGEFFVVRQASWEAIDPPLLLPELAIDDDP